MRQLTGTAGARQHLESLIAKVDRKHRDLLISVRRALAKRFPTANELVYEYRHALVVGYSPNEHGIEAVVALWASGEGLRLYFLNGHKLPDPTKSLLGSGKQTRYIEVESLAKLKRPEVVAFLKAVAGLAKTPLRATGRGQIHIKTRLPKKATKKKASKPKPAKKKATRRA
jgi:hypothetical protein